MGAMKEFITRISEEMGYEGTINKEVIEETRKLIENEEEEKTMEMYEKGLENG